MNDFAENFKDRYFTDAKGRLVPIDLVTEVDKLRDHTVREIVEKAQVLSDALSSFKASVLGDLEAFVSLSAEKYGVPCGGNKGNLSLLSYDGKYRVLRAVADRIVFDERLQIAKQLVDECLHDWAEGARPEIRALVLDAFQVDKQGRINTQRVLELRRLKIDDPKWRRAMEAISDSLQVTGSQSYVRLYERIGNTDKWRQIGLDLASA